MKKRKLYLYICLYINNNKVLLVIICHNIYHYGSSQEILKWKISDLMLFLFDIKNHITEVLDLFWFKNIEFTVNIIIHEEIT